MFAIAAALCAASVHGLHIYSSDTTVLEAGWSVDLWRGRMLASLNNPLSSYLTIPAEPTWRNAGGFSFEHRTWGSGAVIGGSRMMATHLALPTYPLPLLAGLLLAWRIRQYRRFPKPGCCTRCGYDLRATPGRCPECGLDLGVASKP